MILARREGFTLVELVIAMLLSALVMAAVCSALTPLVQTQVYAARAQTVQLSLAAVNQLAERELRQASLVSEPAGAGMPSGVLAGCANAAGSPPAKIDSSAPMRWFALCASGGIVYYHSGAGCPASYACGASPAASWGSVTWPLLEFARPSAGSTLVAIRIKARKAESEAEMTSAVAFAAPAGGAQ